MQTGSKYAVSFKKKRVLISKAAALFEAAWRQASGASRKVLEQFAVICSERWPWLLLHFIVFSCFFPPPPLSRCQLSLRPNCFCESIFCVELACRDVDVYCYCEKAFSDRGREKATIEIWISLMNCIVNAAAIKKANVSFANCNTQLANALQKKLCNR